MKRLMLLLACVALLMAGNAFAQLDPDDDGIGIYVDPCGCTNCVPLAEGTHTLYLVITHASAPDGVHGWECSINWDGPVLPYDWAYEGLAFNADNAPEFGVGLAEPLVNPYTFPAILVMEFTAIITDESVATNFYIDAWRWHSLDEEVPAYLNGADIYEILPLQQVTGGPDIPVATFNGDCAVATEDLTWSSVKQLYR